VTTLSSWDGLPQPDPGEWRWTDLVLIVVFAAIVVAIGIFAAGGPS
jgi:hypothetical protein